MSQITKPHDAIFKTFMSDLTVARDFLKAHLEPALLAQCDLSTLQLESPSFIASDMRERLSDILYSLETKDKKHTIYTYLIVEHQSSPDKQMPFRMLESQVEVMRYHLNQERSKKLPTIIPILFYQGKKAYPYSIELKDCFEQPELVDQVFPARIRLIDLTRMADEALLTHEHAAAFQMVMRDIRMRDIAHIAADILQSLRAYPLPVALVGNLLKYLSRKGKCEDKKAFFTVLDQYPAQYEANMATLAQELRQEGMQQGMQQGRQEGRRALLLDLFKSKFSSLSLDDERRFMKADDETLTKWSKRLLFADTPAQVFQEH